MLSVLLVSALEDRLAEAMISGASVVALDLVAEAGSPDGRRAKAATWLQGARNIEHPPALYVRINELASEGARDDLDALFPMAPDGIMLPHCQSVEEVQRLGAWLAVREAEHALPDGGIGIVAIAASSASGVLALQSYSQAGPRLRALAWDRDALATDLGLDPAEDAAPLVCARSLTVLAARAAGIPALDGIVTGDAEAVARACGRGRRDGFKGALTRNIESARLVSDVYGGTIEAPRLKIP